jgi:hypothetical protein
MLTVGDTEIATQIFYLDLEIAASHYYTQYFTGPSEQCAVVVWPRGRHPTEREQRCCVIRLVTTMTGIPAENTHSNNRNTMRLCCLFGNSMEYSAICDDSIDQVMLNYVVQFIVTVRMLAAGHSHNLYYDYGVRVWIVFISFFSNQLFCLIRHLRSLNIKIDFNIIFPSDSSSKYFNKYITISLIPLPSFSFPHFIQSS